MVSLLVLLVVSVICSMLVEGVEVSFASWRKFFLKRKNFVKKNMQLFVFKKKNTIYHLVIRASD